MRNLQHFSRKLTAALVQQILIGCLLACLHDACTHDVCTHDAFTMYIAMIYLDPDACGYDAHVPNADEYVNL